MSYIDKVLKEDAKSKLKTVQDILKVIKDNNLETASQIKGVIYSFEDSLTEQAYGNDKNEQA